MLESYPTIIINAKRCKDGWMFVTLSCAQIVYNRNTLIPVKVDADVGRSKSLINEVNDQFYLVCLVAWTPAAAAACRELALAARPPRCCLRPRFLIPTRKHSVKSKNSFDASQYHTTKSQYQRSSCKNGVQRKSVTHSSSNLTLSNSNS